MAGSVKSGLERRRYRRRVPDAEEPLARLRTRTGWDLAVIDLSNSGALVEGGVRLLPGTHVDVHVVTREGRVLARARVVRVHVCRVEPDSVSYRGALAFERSVDTAPRGYVVPTEPPADLGPAGNGYPVEPARFQV